MTTAQNKAVFLSYAREDAASARRIATALRSAGVEVWFDEDELRGGDAWDANIRRQIRDCALFVALISANTDARREGYFRREWKQAVERLEDIAEGVPFLVPVCIDRTSERNALVPRPFLHVQWTRLHSENPLEAFVAHVVRLLNGKTRVPFAANASGHDLSPPTAPPVAAVAPVAPAKSLPLLATLGVTVLVALAALALWQFGPAVDTPAPARAAASAPNTAGKPTEKSIAVLAFANTSDERAGDHFGEGISEELLNVLAKIPGLRVAARNSAFFFKDKNVPLKQIAQELGVTHLVVGSVRKSETRIRVRAELVAADDAFPIWSDSFEKEQKDVLTLQEEIAGQIAQQLSLKLGASGRAAKAVHPQAHALVLEGRHFWNQRTPEGFARAEEVYMQAMQLDPTFAEAHAGLADVWMIRGWYKALAGSPATDADFSQAKVSAERARQLDPLLAAPHACLAGVFYNQWKFAEAEQQFTHAFALQPNYPMAHHWRAHMMGSVGRIDEALHEMERALSLDPLAFISRWSYSAHLNYAGRHETALHNTERGLKISPKFIPLHGDRAHALACLGRMEEAVAAARAVTGDPAFQPRFYADSDATYVLMKAGLRSEAEAFANKLIADLPANSHHRAFLLAALGRAAEGLDLLPTARPSTMTRVFFHPIWEPVRNTAQLDALVKKLGCEKEYQLARQASTRMQRQR